MSILYNEVEPFSPLVPALEAAMLPHALKAFKRPATAPAWKEKGFDDRRVCIRTLDDHCNPLFLQDIWIEKSGVK